MSEDPALARWLNAQRQVIEAAREWANNVDHRDHDLLTALRREVANLERIEKERGHTKP